MSNVNVIEKTIAGVPTDYYYEDTAGRDMIAAEQDLSLVAIKDYAVGELFWYNNLLYRAKTQIEENATIVLATDAEQTTVSAELATKQNTLTFDDAPTANSNNPVTSGGTKSAIDASQNASLQMLEDTVGWTGKNFINYENLVDKTSSAHELTSTGIRSYTTSNGTYRGSYIYLPQYPKNKALKLSCDITVTSGQAFMGIFASNDGSDYTTQVAAITSTTTDTSVNLDVPSSNYKYYRININCTMATSGAGDATFSNLMLRLASVSDDTFEPYHEDVESCKYNRSEANILGAKNLYKPVPAGTKTVENIDWIINADGTVEADGTCSSTSSKLQITERYGRSGEKQFFPNGKYIINGNPDNSITFLQVGVTKNGAYISLAQGVGDVAFEVDGDDSSNDGAYVQIVCGVLKNTTVSHVLFKPMIRLASDPNDTYVPYAKTNKQLTDEMPSVIETSALLGSDAATYGITLDSASANNKIVKWGNVVNFKVGIVVANEVTLSDNNSIVNLGYSPILNNPRIDVIKRESPYESLGGHGRVGTDGGINLRYLTLQAGTYDLCGTYICQ